MNNKPPAILLAISQHYYLDSLDFAERFDILSEYPLTKTGRIKRFIDLFMGCECILKAHLFIGLINCDPKQIYTKVRKIGHKINELADLACFNSNRTNYDFLKKELQPFSVLLRYSLDASDAFFPFFYDWHNARIDYANTIGNESWVASIRRHLNSLIEEISDEYSVLNIHDLSELSSYAKNIEALMAGKNSS